MSAPNPLPAVEHRVSLAERNRHLYAIESSFSVEADTLELSLPVWTPGSYLIREYQRHVQDLHASDEQDRALPVEKVGKASWRITRPTAVRGRVRVRYLVYAHELTVRTSHLDASHAYWNGATLFFYADSSRAAMQRVHLAAVPSDWHVSTGLERADDGAFEAPDYDALIDSPFEIGTHARHLFTVDGKPHELCIWGPGDVDGDKLAGELSRIIGEQRALFDGLPYERYVFLLHLLPGGHGGLEHRNSTTLIASPFAPHQPNKYLDLLELASHEFFHLWNVKRVRPSVLGPFDYTREAHTRSLWVVEGWTSYYDRLFLRRAGLMTPERYLEKLGEELSKLATIPGRAHQSLEESSFDAWIKLYRPDENTTNTTVSYYLKGSIVALLLDLELRRRTRAIPAESSTVERGTVERGTVGRGTVERGLDDVLRRLWSDYGQRDRGYRDDELQGIVERVAGVSLDDFFARSVRGREELDVEGPLSSVGLRLKTVEPEGGEAGADADASARKGAWLGATVNDDLKVTEVLEASPAQAAGVSPGDVLVALDGWRLDDDRLKALLAQRSPGDGARFTFFRRDHLRELTVTLGAPPRTKVQVVAAESPTPEAQEAYAKWMKAPWPPTSK